MITMTPLQLKIARAYLALTELPLHRRFGHITMREVAERVGRRPASIYYTIKRMADHGILTKKGRGYELTVEVADQLRRGPRPATGIKLPGLTPEQRKLAIFVYNTQQRRGRSPSLKEVARHLGVSTRCAEYRIKMLVRGRILKQKPARHFSVDLEPSVRSMIDGGLE